MKEQHKDDDMQSLLDSDDAHHPNQPTNRNGGLKRMSTLDHSLGDDPELWDLNLKQILEYLLHILKPTAGFLISFFMVYLVISVNLHYIGQLKDTALTVAIGMGSFYVGLCGLALTQCLNSSVSVVASQQSNPRAEVDLISSCYERGLIMLLPLWVLQAILFGSSEYLMMWIFGDAETARIAKYYVFCCFPCLIFFGYSDCTKGILITFGYYIRPFLYQLATVSLHLILCMVFVNVFRLGIIGPALSRNVVEILMALLIFFYARRKFKKLGFEYSFSFSRLKGWLTQLKFSLPILVTIYFENLLLLFLLCLTARVKNQQELAAYFAVKNIHGFVYVLCIAPATTTGNLVVQSASMSHDRKAKNYLRIGIILVLILAFVESIIIANAKYQFGWFYSSDPKIIAQTARLLSIYTIGVIPENIVYFCDCFMRTLGKYTALTLFQLFFRGFMLMGLGYYLGFIQGQGIAGILYAYIIVVVASAIIMIIYLSRLDWGEEKVLFSEQVAQQLADRYQMVTYKSSASH